MTMFGKVLVFINLAFSVMLAAISLGLYTNRLDWTASPATAGKEPGELVELRKEVQELWSRVPPAVTAWDGNRKALRLIEQGAAPDGSGSLTADREWYESELEHLRTKASEQAPARQVDVQRGVIVLDRNNHNRPKMSPVQDQFGDPLRSLLSYFNEEKAILDDLTRERERYQMAIDKDSELTASLIGPKGLKQRILDEREKLAKVEEEHRIIRPKLINAAVDSENILRRRYTLEARRRELLKALGSENGGL